MNCQFIYNGHTGPTGKVCDKPESDHCPERANDCEDLKSREHKGKVHHAFTRKRKCPTCGCSVSHEATA